MERAVSSEQRQADQFRERQVSGVIRNIGDSINDKIVLMTMIIIMLITMFFSYGMHVRKLRRELVLSQAFKLKTNDCWSTYFKEVKDARRAFDRLNIPPEQAKGVLWNAIFS